MSDTHIQSVPEPDGMAAAHDHLATLASLSQSFATSLDIDETLQHAIAQITAYLQAEAASIFLLDESQRTLECRVCVGPIDLKGLRLGAEQGIVGKAVRENRVQMVRDVSAEPEFAQSVDRKTGFTTRSILCAPLSVKDRRFGAIELINKKTADGLFAADDRNMLSALAASAALAIHNAAMAAELVEQERMRKELELAREIQSNFLPDAAAAGFPVHGVNIPMREVSGDFYDYFELDDGRIYFNIGDVSGKGMNAALLMAKTSSLFHCLGKTVHSPAELLGIINNEIYENTTRGMFVTMVGGLLDPASGTVRLANAGHQPPLVYTAAGEFYEIEGNDPPLGILPGLRLGESSCELHGGSLYLYTDGLSEAPMAGGGQLGVAGIRTLIAEHHGQPPGQRLRSMLEQLTRHGLPLHDDLTVLLLEPTA